jgi:hypothetical protein
MKEEPKIGVERNKEELDKAAKAAKEREAEQTPDKLKSPGDF